MNLAALSSAGLYLVGCPITDFFTVVMLSGRRSHFKVLRLPGWMDIIPGQISYSYCLIRPMIDCVTDDLSSNCIWWIDSTISYYYFLAIGSNDVPTRIALILIVIIVKTLNTPRPGEVLPHIGNGLEVTMMQRCDRHGSFYGRKKVIPSCPMRAVILTLRRGSAVSFGFQSQKNLHTPPIPQ
jgi:hypothetical protein